MGTPYPTVEVREGAAHLRVPDVPRRKGPGARGPWPFYNPTMSVSRDLSAIVLSKWPRRPRTVLDGLAGTGAWGIRMAMEAGVGEVVLNDRSRLAADLIEENANLNRLSAKVFHGDFAARLGEASYDFVDLDPFGPPTPFLDAFFDEARPGSGLGVTATDTAVLCGTYPAASARRYGSLPLRGPQGSEIGLRILIGYCSRLAAKRRKSIRPVLAFAAEHFLRVHLLVASGRAPPLGLLKREDAGVFVSARRGEGTATGPLWLGPLGEPDLVRHLTPTVWTSIRSARLLALLQQECDFPPLFVTTDEIAARERRSAPKIDCFLEGLRAIGHTAARTHFHPRGVKTDAPREDVLRVFRERSPTGPMGG